METKAYQVIAKEAQQKVLDSIPQQWRLPDEVRTKDHKDMQASSLQCAQMQLTKSQIEITNLTASELLARMHTVPPTLTSVEVTEAFCARAAIAHQLVNCVVEFFPEEAVAQAKAMDQLLSETGKPVGPLHGLPISIKDILKVQGRTTTMGFTAWYEKAPDAVDASVVKVMRDAGAIVFCRTTCPQSGMALETVSNLWGRTLNAYNSAFGSGGSSGGEAALVAMRGAPASPLSTDIGGSIRGPAAFNGLYGMRPTYERVPRTGFVHPALGNGSIKSAAGPCCHSMADLELFVKLIVTHPTLPYEPTCCLPYWDEAATKQPILGSKKLRIGLMLSDGVVEPHPPVKRALTETAAKLQLAGHGVVPFTSPFDCWEAMQTTFALFFQTGAKEAKALLEEAGEPPIVQFDYNLKVFDVKELTAAESFAYNRKQAGYRAAFQEAWDAAGIDVLLCPPAPMAGVPHDFPIWWGYTCLFNLLDYPSAVLPVKGFKINESDDAKDSSYQPKSGNPFDKPNWGAYDPELWKLQPVTVQIVGRPYRDEKLIADMVSIDNVVNGG